MAVEQKVHGGTFCDSIIPCSHRDAFLHGGRSRRSPWGQSPRPPVVTLWWGWLLAPLIGLLLALFGAGGGMTTVPLLTHLLHMPLKQAIASSLWIVAAVSLAALLRHNPWREIHWPLLGWFAAGGVVGGWLGAQVGLVIPAAVQSALFGALTWFVAWWMGRPKPHALGGGSACRCAHTLLVGALLGVVTGVLGVGGGFLMVPALLWLGVPDYRLAVAHSLLLITGNALAAAVGWLGRVALAPAPLVVIALLAMVGSLLGNWLLQRLPVERLQEAFRLLLVVIGGVMFRDAL
ncbi:MAG: sulfite exporter TauE/SafE family protein [Zetaproteobacteria bacterium]|nr:MAG: sulfite exporter TauE/SafE family protein [Zetaproteobacteria bacterium]